jgi:hypothetical protein
MEVLILSEQQLQQLYSKELVQRLSELVTSLQKPTAADLIKFC